MRRVLVENVTVDYTVSHVPTQSVPSIKKGPSLAVLAY
jgi:hypothetical protein